MRIYALVEAGDPEAIDVYSGITFHDLRHTFISLMAHGPTSTFP
jgi:hypothetical protein